MAISPSDKSVYEIEYENYKDNVERYYFFLVEFLKDNLGYEVEKTEDTYNSSVTSSFFGNVEMRKGAQQDKFAQYFGTIGGMVKSLQQMLHDLRIMEQRLNYYRDSNKGDKAAEMALKSMWIDLVEGGGQNASSVIGLAQKAGFVTLPDLFFDLMPKNKDEVAPAVDKIDFVNDQVKNILKRKLWQYYEWKASTETEISTRWDFTLKYLRQHFNVIKLYLNWMRPYLKNIKKLQGGETISEVDLIASSEGAVVDLEILGVKKFSNFKLQTKRGLGGKFTKYFPVCFIRIHWRARAMLRDEYNRTGAIHLGRANIKFYNYILTEDEIDAYRKRKDEEDMELLTAVDASIEALKEELNKRLEQAGEVVAKETPKAPVSKKKIPGIQTLTQIGDSIGQIGKGAKQLSNFLKFGQKSKMKFGEEQEFGEAKSKSELDLRICYEVFKKAHRMIQW